MRLRIRSLCFVSIAGRDTIATRLAVTSSTGVEMKRRRLQSIVSILLLLTSAGLLALGAFLYFDDEKQPEEPARPTAVPGHYQLIDVIDAIDDAGVTTEIGDAQTNVRSRMLGTAGQMLKAGDGAIYVFVYPDIATQEEATLDVLPEDVDLIGLGGDPIQFEDAILSANSNVAVMIIGLDDKDATRVDKAIQDLP